MRKSLPLALSLLFLAACSKNNENPNALNDQDRIFLNKVYQVNKTESEAGQLALDKSTDGGLKNFAQSAIATYSAAQKDLFELVNKIGFRLDTNSVQTMSASLNELSGHSFDMAYIQSRVSSHRQILGIYQSELNEGNQTYVRYYYLNKYIDRIRLLFQQADSLSRRM